MKKHEVEAVLGVIIAVMAVILLLMALTQSDKKENTRQEDSQPDTIITEEETKEETTEEVKKETETETEKEILEVSLVAVGDNLIHDNVIKCGLMEDGSYNYDELFEILKDDFVNADIAVINQETILGGSEYGYSGYPNFNTPYEMGDAIINAGFDVVLQASNHSLDMGVNGAKNCIAYWKEHSDEITMLGLNESADEQNTIKIIERNGITFALLNYTYGINGNYLPESEYYLINFLDEEQVISDIERAESLADFTILFPHWGTEYSYEANSEQKNLAEKMTEAGADLIIGAHAHVLQPVEWIEAENGNRALCYYSLGNYTSGQDATPRILGGMAKVSIIKEDDEVYIDDAGIVPLVTHYIWGTNRINQTYKLYEYTQELAMVHSLRYYDSTFSIDYLKQLADDIVGEWIFEK